MPAVVTAEDCTHLLITTVDGWLPDLGWQPDATLIACSLMYDEPTASDGSGGAVTRVLVGRDIDGGLYQAACSLGDTEQAVTAGGEPASVRIAATAEALTKILDNRVVGVLQLPTTGYIILHTVHPDGEEAYVATVFIDSTNATDDDQATAHSQKEWALLRHAPSSVEHTLRLVHRTDIGDREVWAAEPVRGAGPPRV
jgi:hypothetical protein